MAAAHADTIFTLNYSACSSGCSVLPAGTITLSQNGANDVKVTVQLTNDYSFRNAPDNNHHALAFDLAGVSGAVTASNINNSSFTFDTPAPGSYKDAGLGSNFNYAFEYGSNASVQKLSFDLIATGLTESSFVSNGSYYFGVDVTGLTSAAGVGLTGNLGASGPGVITKAATPEPSSLLLLATGIMGAFPAVRRKLVRS